MAHDKHEEEDEPLPPAEMLQAAAEAIEDLEARVRKLGDTVDDVGAGIRLEIAQSRREILEVRNVLVRLQGRFDSQLMTLALANIASGVGVAALVLGAAHAFT